MSRLDVTLDPKAASGRRIEVISGGGGRRRWSNDEKARAIEASVGPGVVISEVARAHGVTPQQLFGWRREARLKAARENGAPPFVPAIVEAPSGPAAPTHRADGDLIARLHAIELEIEGSSVWIWRGAETAMVATIIGALKAVK